MWNAPFVMLGMFFLTLSTGPAEAQGRPNWSGLYFGIHAERAAFKANGFTDTQLIVDDLSYDLNPYGVGANVHALWQVDAMVVGLGVTGAILRGDRRGNCLSTVKSVSTAAAKASYDCNAGSDWSIEPFATLGRTFLSGRLHIYGLAGLRLQDVRLQISEAYSSVVAGQPVSEFAQWGGSRRVLGLSLGVGAEMALSNELSLAVEFRHVALANVAFDGIFTQSGTYVQRLRSETSLDLSSTEARMSLNYRVDSLGR